MGQCILNKLTLTSVKGNAESVYRTGQINLTPANLGISATTSSVTVGSITFNKYTHPTSAGNKHIPSGGSSGQILGWSSAGTAQWLASINSDSLKIGIDSNNLLATLTSTQVHNGYTATQDCWLILTPVTANDETWINIDDVQVLRQWSSGTNYCVVPLFLHKGQKVSRGSGHGVNVCYVYGTK